MKFMDVDQAHIIGFLRLLEEVSFTEQVSNKDHSLTNIKERYMAAPKMKERRLVGISDSAGNWQAGCLLSVFEDAQQVELTTGFFGKGRLHSFFEAFLGFLRIEYPGWHFILSVRDHNIGLIQLLEDKGKAAYWQAVAFRWHPEDHRKGKSIAPQSIGWLSKNGRWLDTEFSEGYWTSKRMARDFEKWLVFSAEGNLLTLRIHPQQLEVFHCIIAANETFDIFFNGINQWLAAQGYEEVYSLVERASTESTYFGEKMRPQEEYAEFVWQL